MARPRTLSLLLAAAALPAGAVVDFARDIQPLLAEHCLLCHGPDDSKGGLTLTSFELATRALKSGAHAIVPGQPHSVDNIQWVCRRVNLAKNDFPDSQFRAWAKEAFTWCGEATSIQDCNPVSNEDDSISSTYTYHTTEPIHFPGAMLS